MDEVKELKIEIENLTKRVEYLEKILNKEKKVKILNQLLYGVYANDEALHLDNGQLAMSFSPDNLVDAIMHNLIDFKEQNVDCVNSSITIKKVIVTPEETAAFPAVFMNGEVSMTNENDGIFLSTIYDPLTEDGSCHTEFEIEEEEEEDSQITEGFVNLSPVQIIYSYDIKTKKFVKQV